MRLMLRYVALIAGSAAWLAVLNTLLDRHTALAAAFGAASVAVYGWRRWRTPSAIRLVADGLEVIGNGTPTVVEFYSDM